MSRCSSLTSLFYTPTTNFILSHLKTRDTLLYFTSHKKLHHIVTSFILTFFTSITTYNNNLRRITKHLPRFSYTSNPNLSNKLVRAKLKQAPDYITNTVTIPNHKSNRDTIKSLAKLQFDVHPYSNLARTQNVQYIIDLSSPI